MERNKIIHDDCIEVMKELPKDSVDVIIAGPPYNCSREAGTWEWEEKEWSLLREDWDAFGWHNYRAFTNAWITEAARILKPTGTIWVFCSYHNAPYVNLAIREHGEILNQIAWYKRDAFVNQSGRRFTASHETIYWAHLNGDERDYYFDYDAMKDGSFPTDRLKERGKQMRSVWDVPKAKKGWEKEYGTHPTQKPARLYERIIEASTEEGDLMFAPFLGAGTSAVVAKKMGRDYIGCDVNEEYLQIARKRLESEVHPSQMSSAVSW